MNQYNSMLNQLLQYGLNPQEWQIHPVKNELFEIRKVDDPQFCFKGILKNTIWKKIWLVSI